MSVSIVVVLAHVIVRHRRPSSSCVVVLRRRSASSRSFVPSRDVHICCRLRPCCLSSSVIVVLLRRLLSLSSVTIVIYHPRPSPSSITIVHHSYSSLLSNTVACHCSLLTSLSSVTVIRYPLSLSVSSVYYRVLWSPVTSICHRCSLHRCSFLTFRSVLYPSGKRNTAPAVTVQHRFGSAAKRRRLISDVTSGPVPAVGFHCGGTPSTETLHLNYSSEIHLRPLVVMSSSSKPYEVLRRHSLLSP